MSEPQQQNNRRFTPGSALTVLAVCVFTVAFIAVAVLLVMKIAGVGG